MCDTPTLLAFLAASAALVVVPGPSQALVVSRTLEAGRMAGLLTAIGLNVATLLHAAAAGLGLSALLATSALVFGIVKTAGAAYLIYLGLRALTARETVARATGASSSRRAFLQAVATGLLNPKVALFFLAFLPQFVCPSRGPVLLQFLALGAILAILDAAYEAGLVLVAARLSAGGPGAAWRSRVAGAILVGLGARLALAEPR